MTFIPHANVIVPPVNEQKAGSGRANRGSVKRRVPKSVPPRRRRRSAAEKGMWDMTGMLASYSPFALSFAFLFFALSSPRCIVGERMDVDVSRRALNEVIGPDVIPPHPHPAIVASSPSARIASPGTICLRTSRLVDWLPAFVTREKGPPLSRHASASPFLAA